jgi:hypothetical protein
MTTKREIIESVRSCVKDKINYDWESVLEKVYDLAINSVPGLNSNNLLSYTIIGGLVILCIVKNEKVAYVDIDLYNKITMFTLYNNLGSIIDDENLTIVEHSWVYTIKEGLKQITF